MSMELRKDPTTLVTLIVSIIVIGFSVLFAYLSNKSNEELKLVLLDKQKEMQDKKDFYEASVRTFHDLSAVVGWYNPEDIEKASSYTKITKELNEWNQILKEKYKYDQFPMWSLTEGTAIEQDVADKGIPVTALIEKLEEYIKTNKSDSKQSQDDFEQHAKAARAYQGEEGRYLEREKEKTKELAVQYRREVEKRTDILETVKKGEDTLKDLQRQIEKERGSIDKIKKEKEKEYADLKIQKAELEKRFDFMTAEPIAPKEGIEIDGRLTEVFQSTAYAYVDIGRKDCLFPGTNFAVYRLLKDGVPRRIGEITILDIIEDNLSKAAIVSTVSPDTVINAGDYVANPKFDQNTPKVFVIVGRLKLKYSNETVTQKLTDLGWRVDPAISIYTTFAIIGEGFMDSQEFKTAQQLGISMLGERELLQLID